MFCIFDHGPQTGAIRMTSGACPLMISMTMLSLHRILRGCPRSPNLKTRQCTALTESGTSCKDLENVDLSLTYTVPMCLFRNRCEVLDEHVLCWMRCCRFWSCCFPRYVHRSPRGPRTSLHRCLTSSTQKPSSPSYSPCSMMKNVLLRLPP